MSEDNFPVDRFQDLYSTRQRLIRQNADNSGLFDDAIEDTNGVLLELSKDPEVQSFLHALGQPALSLCVEVERVETIGEHIDDNQNGAVARFEEMISSDYRLSMVLEFADLSFSQDQEVEWRSKRTATEGQLEFASSIGLEIPATTSRVQAKKIIDKEVNRRSREELATGNWRIYTLVKHPRHGICEITKIHEKSHRVTLKPIEVESRSFAVPALYLTTYEVVQED